ncbi:hypothetical protein BTJ45_02937 [Bacillus mycoides]|nr:hypothetical protein BTJ45_02937 [Bacillus mycoides]
MNNSKKKRIFKINVANFLIKNGAELVEIRDGEVKDDPKAITFLFRNDEKLSEALLNLKNRI